MQTRTEEDLTQMPTATHAPPSHQAGADAKPTQRPNKATESAVQPTTEAPPTTERQPTYGTIAINRRRSNPSTTNNHAPGEARPAKSPPSSQLKESAQPAGSGAPRCGRKSNGRGRRRILEGLQLQQAPVPPANAGGGGGPDGKESKPRGRHHGTRAGRAALPTK